MERDQRGEALRRVLLDLIEQADRNGVWPERPPPAPAGGPALVYLRPGKFDTSDAATLVHTLGSTVVAHEPIERHPGGAWVGYADGHVEFAATAADLAACRRWKWTRRRSPSSWNAG